MLCWVCTEHSSWLPAQKVPLSALLYLILGKLLRTEKGKIREIYPEAVHGGRSRDMDLKLDLLQDSRLASATGQLAVCRGFFCNISCFWREILGFNGPDEGFSTFLTSLSQQFWWSGNLQQKKGSQKSLRSSQPQYPCTDAYSTWVKKPHGRSSCFHIYS